ncbi:MAG: sigma-70 family RNA polymerase sigma factor, partial [Pseudomonadota bacterium]
MTRYRDGDNSAFDALYERHRGGLYRFMLRQCATQAIAEELFQDIWMRVIKARATYEPTAKFTTWLYQMARNRLIDNHRRASVRPVASGSVDADTLTEPQAPDAERPDRRAQSEQGMQALLALVDALPAEQRQAFLLREEAGM